MPIDDVVDFLVVTDRTSVDVVDLYPPDGPVSGSSSVSVPLRLSPPGGVVAARITVSSAPHDHESGGATVLWSGSLATSSGDLVVSDWSMELQANIQVRQGAFDLTVTQDPLGHLSLDLVEAPADQA